MSSLNIPRRSSGAAASGRRGVRTPGSVLVADPSRPYHDFHYARVSDEVARLQDRISRLEGQLYQPALTQTAEVAEPGPDTEVAERVARLEEDLEFLQGVVNDFLDRQEPEEEPEPEAVEEPQAVVAEPVPADPDPEPENKQSWEYFKWCWRHIDSDIDEVMRVWEGNG